MIKKKRKYNPNRIKSRLSYRIQEIAKVYGLHVRTVQNWRKQGLKAIDENTRPYLILGEEVRIFLRAKARKRKHILQPDEFYCTKCHYPRKSIPDKFTCEITNKNLGKRYKHAIIRGVCEVCNNPLFRFSSDRVIEEMKKKGVLFTEHEKVLIGNGYCSLNTDIREEVEYAKCEL